MVDLDAVEARAAAATPFPGYRVDEAGRVFSEIPWRGTTSRELTQIADEHGYLYVRMRVRGRRRKVFVHRLVAAVFHGHKPTPEHEVRHLDGCRANNAAANLAWGTRAENAADRDRHGRTARGDRNGARTRPDRLARGDRNGMRKPRAALKEPQR